MMCRKFIFGIISKIFSKDIDRLVAEAISTNGCKGELCDRIKSRMDEVLGSISKSIDEYIIYDVRPENIDENTNWRDVFIRNDNMCNALYHIVKHKFRIDKTDVKSILDKNSRSAVAVSIMVFNPAEIQTESLVNKTNKHFYVVYGDSIFKVPDSFHINQGGLDGRN